VSGDFLDGKDFLPCVKSATIIDYASIADVKVFIFSLAKDSLVPVANAKKFVNKA
jgi:hypothetical protein